MVEAIVHPATAGGAEDGDARALNWSRKRDAAGRRLHVSAGCGRRRWSLIVAFFALFWVYSTYRAPAPTAPETPPTAVVPPGFVPDPELHLGATHQRAAAQGARGRPPRPPRRPRRARPRRPRPDRTRRARPRRPTPTPTTTVVDPDGPGPVSAASRCPVTGAAGVARSRRRRRRPTTGPERRPARSRPRYTGVP